MFLHNEPMLKNPFPFISTHHPITVIVNKTFSGFQWTFFTRATSTGTRQRISVSEQFSIMRVAVTFCFSLFSAFLNRAFSDIFSYPRPAWKRRKFPFLSEPSIMSVTKSATISESCAAFYRT